MSIWRELYINDSPRISDFRLLNDPPGAVIDALERINQSNQSPAPFVLSVLLAHDGDTLVPENVHHRVDR